MTLNSLDRYVPAAVEQATLFTFLSRTTHQKYTGRYTTAIKVCSLHILAGSSHGKNAQAAADLQPAVTTKPTVLWQ
jgi:hypothetical protein